MAGNQIADLLAEGIQETSLSGVCPAIAGPIARAQAQAIVARGGKLTVATVGSIKPVRDGFGATVQRVVRKPS